MSKSFYPRALLKDAPIILLDEATSFLDIKNESLVKDAISKRFKEKTVLVIVHRMRTIAGVDQIVHIKDSKVAKDLITRYQFLNTTTEKNSVSMTRKSSEKVMFYEKIRYIYLRGKRN